MRSDILGIASLRTFWRDERGAALLEFTAVIVTLLTILFGIIEFSLAYSQWNLATKAMQVGARLAAVSSPVWNDLDKIRGDERATAIIPGDVLNSHLGTGQAANFGYKVVCDGSVSTTDCTKVRDDTGVTPPLSTALDINALRTIVFGRGPNVCGDLGVGGLSAFGMCDIYPPIRPENVSVTYEHNNLGYATRPGGVVPTIKVELKNLFFNFLFLDGLLGLKSVQIPGLVTTIPAEDLCSSKPDLPKWDNPC
jgi:hypothetical protein